MKTIVALIFIIVLSGCTPAMQNVTSYSIDAATIVFDAAQM